ncbi:MAG: hypothetical protein V2A34_09295, partial [Lentisphaerota bacterium]
MKQRGFFFRIRTALYLAAGAGLSLLLAAGCASPSQQKSYVILQRYFSEHEDDQQTQTPQAILQVKNKAAEYEQALIKSRLSDLRKEKKNSPRHISTIQKLMEECESDLVLDTPPEELAVHLQEILPQATNVIRAKVVEWAQDAAPLTLDAWHEAPAVQLFRESLDQEKSALSTAFADGLKKAKQYSEAGQCIEAVETAAGVAAFEPNSPELNQTFNSILEQFSKDMKSRAGKRQYWQIFSSCARQLELADRLLAQPAHKAFGEAVHQNAVEVFSQYYRGMADYLLDMADKHSSLWQQHGFALGLCDKLDELGRFAETIDNQKLREESVVVHDEAARARQNYTEKTVERLQRFAYVDNIRAPFHKAEGELLTLRIEKAIQETLKSPPGNIWYVHSGASAAGPNSENTQNDYWITDSTLETIQVNTPELMEDELVTYQTISSQETVYDVTRQRIITHHVQRKKYHEEAKLTGWVTLKHANRSDEVPLALSREHEYVVEEEDPATRETRFEATPPVRKTQTYEPTIEKPLDPNSLKEQLREEAVALIMERLLAVMTQYPEELR